jgi:cell division septation protein DedD
MKAHYRQALPNRRFRRLLPAVLASAALATTSMAGPAAAKTSGDPHAKPPKPTVVNAAAAPVTRSPRAQPTTET